MPTRRPSIKISASAGVVSSRNLPLGASTPRRTAGRDGAAGAGRPAAESRDALTAGAGRRDGRPSSPIDPSATRAPPASPAHRPAEIRGRGRVGGGAGGGGARGG